MTFSIVNILVGQNKFIRHKPLCVCDKFQLLGKLRGRVLLLYKAFPPERFEQLLGHRDNLQTYTSRMSPTFKFSNQPKFKPFKFSVLEIWVIVVEFSPTPSLISYQSAFS